MKIVADKDNGWSFSAWVINLKPWSFISVVWVVDWHEMGVGIRWNTGGFVEFFLLPIALRVSYRDCRKDRAADLLERGA